MATAFTILGGIEVGAKLCMKQPCNRVIDIYGRWFEHDRSDAYSISNYEGSVWTVTYFSWRKVQKTQPYAVYMIDSVVNGSLFDVAGPGEPPECARTSVKHEMDICHSDKKYPPWLDQPCDEHGMPEPMQPPNRGPDNKWDVVPPTVEELDAAMKRCGVTGNKYLTEEHRLHVRKLLAYTWHMYDHTLRPVDSPPGAPPDQGDRGCLY